VGTDATVLARYVDVIEEGGELPHLPCAGIHPCPTCEREPNKGLAGTECGDAASVAVRSPKKEGIYLRYVSNFVCLVLYTVQSNIMGDTP
jgi:hypothetical protein